MQLCTLWKTQTVWRMTNKNILFLFQGTASLLLTTLEKEKELLRIFLKVSQMENSMLRRMNLSSFLMVSWLKRWTRIARKVRMHVWQILIKNVIYL